MNRSDARDAGVVVRTELRTRARRLRTDTRRLLATGFLVVVFGVVLPAAVAGSVLDYGSELASGDVPLGTTGAALAGVGAFAAYLGGASGFNQEGVGAVGPLIRTSVPPTAVSLGRLTSEVIRATAFVVPTSVALLALVGVGAGGPGAPSLVAVAALPVLFASLFVGRIVGDGLRYLNRYFGISLWTKALLFVVVSTAAYVGTQALLFSEAEGGSGPGLSSIPPVLPGEPLQAYAGVALAPLGATARPLGGLVAVAVFAVVPVALWLSIRFETALLGADLSAGREEREESRGVPWPFTSTPASRVAWRYLLRTRRDPRMLAHLTPLLFGGLGAGANVVRNPESVFTLGPSAAVVGGVTLAAAAYCLNPLGDDADQLPLLLTSTRSVSVLLRGRALAGLAVGLAIAVGIGGPLALVEHSVTFALAQSALAVVLAVAGTGTALGLGALVPKFERREYMSVERAHPSMTAVMAVFFGGALVAAVGLIALWWTLDGASPVPVAAVWGAYLLVVGATGGGGYAYAVRKFDALTLDDV